MLPELAGVVAVIEQFPPPEQKAWAARIRAELDDEQAWEQRLASPSEGIRRLAEEARQELRAGLTKL